MMIKIIFIFLFLFFSKNSFSQKRYEKNAESVNLQIKQLTKDSAMLVYEPNFKKYESRIFISKKAERKWKRKNLTYKKKASMEFVFKVDSIVNINIEPRFLDGYDI